MELVQPKITAPIPLLAGGGTPPKKEQIRKPPVSAPALEAMYYGVPMRQDVATVREPSARELLAEKLQAQLERFMPKESAKKGARKITGYTYPMGMADITPAGIPLMAYEGGESLAKAAQAAGEGEYGTAALEGLMGALGVAPAAPAVGALGKAAGKGVAGQIERAMMTGEGPLGGALAAVRPQFATAYHGSPHRFEKFDISKIGTGEGAQAYGHGLYFAESPGVAAEYQRNLGGVEMRDKTGAIIPVPEHVQWVAKDLEKAGGNYEKVRQQLAEHGKDYPWPAAVGTKYIDELEAMGAKPIARGSLYKVDIPDEAVARMLDWDKPLSEQHPDVQRVLAKFDPDMYSPEGSDYDPMEMGQQVYNRLAGILNVRAPGPEDASAKVSAYLRQQGIPGIKYLDEGSRAAGEGTRNFVLFSDELPRILEVNEKPTGALPWAPGEWKTTQE